jgi:hypothetical protein
VLFHFHHVSCVVIKMSKFRGNALGSPVPRRGGKGSKAKSGLDEEAMEEGPHSGDAPQDQRYAV